MSNRMNRATRLTAVASYLEQEFPGRIAETNRHEFMISHDGRHHQVVLDPIFLKKCPDYVHALRETDLADYVRESRAQARRFLVTWHGQNTRIRSTVWHRVVD